LIGEVVAAKGVIFTHWNPERDEDGGVFDDFYLASDMCSWEDKEHCLFLRHEALEDTMRRHGIRGRTGGVNKGGLSNLCHVTGTFERAAGRPFRFELSNLQTITVWIEEYGERTKKVSLDFV
jgi:hypothetical protein